jgi:nitrate reductase beta subunit
MAFVGGTYTPAQFIQINPVRPTRKPYYSNFDYVLSYRNSTQTQIDALTPQLKSLLSQSQIDNITNQGLTYTP